MLSRSRKSLLQHRSQMPGLEIEKSDEIIHSSSIYRISTGHHRTTRSQLKLFCGNRWSLGSSSGTPSPRGDVSGMIKISLGLPLTLNKNATSIELQSLCVALNLNRFVLPIPLVLCSRHRLISRTQPIDTQSVSEVASAAFVRVVKLLT